MDRRPRLNAKILLAGDTKQLKVTARSRLAERIGYEKSWLEELCQKNIYSKNKNTGKFNDMLITELVKNYRSHPEILRISNELFYKNSIEALANTGEC